MPAVYDSLIANQGLTSRVAWRVSFIGADEGTARWSISEVTAVPTILLLTIAAGVYFLWCA
jgi:hypothetical protein